MPQFLLSPSDIQGKRFVLRGPEAFHVVRVLRCKPGQTIELFDGEGRAYAGVVDRVLEDGSVEGTLTGARPRAENPSRVSLNLYLGLLKSSRWEWALEKGTELGVSSFIPVITPRTVVQLRGESRPKLDRWGKIVVAAAKQCGIRELPVLREPAHFRDAIVASRDQGLTILAWEKKPSSSTYAGLRGALEEARKRAKAGKLAVNLFIGPEGGFSDEEVELAECEGAFLVGLGANIMRAETAAIAASAVILYELGAL